MIFSHLSVFLVKFLKNWVKKSKIEIQIFQTLLFFFQIFFNHWRALLTTWMTDWTLKNNNSSIRLAINSKKKALVPPTAKKTLIKNIIWSAPSKLHFCHPHYFSTADNFYQGAQMSKVKITKKITKKMSKITF